MKKIWVMIIVVVVMFAGCREEVIAPNNPAGNINDPIQQRTNNSYTFLINAEDFSYKILVPNTVSGQKYRIVYSLRDYSSGNASVLVLSAAQTVVLSKIIDENADGRILNVDGDSAKQLELNFVNFTGKLSVSLERLQ
jgi:hypothetical protein